MLGSLMIVLATLVLRVGVFAQGDSATLGSIRGQVVTKNQNGEPAALPDTHVVLQSPLHKKAWSDSSGTFAIDGLPPGTYHVEASAPRLNAEVAVEVKAGTGKYVRHKSSQWHPCDSSAMDKVC